MNRTVGEGTLAFGGGGLAASVWLVAIVAQADPQAWRANNEM